MDEPQVIGLSVGIASLAISGIAIFLSVIFFIAAKRSEVQTEKALEGIRAQTDILNQISQQHLGELTQIIANKTPPGETLTQQIRVISDVMAGASSGEGFIRNQTQNQTPTGSTIEEHGIPLLQTPVDSNTLREAALTQYFALYYYTAYANVLSQPLLPAKSEFDNDDSGHKLIRELVNNSAHDFRVISKALDDWAKQEPEFVQSHRLYVAFGQSAQAIKDSVMNTLETWGHR